MSTFSYGIVPPDDAEAWQTLRLEGARDFPLGFLVTVEETASTSLEQARSILGYETTRGVYVGQDLVGFCGYRPQRLQRTQHRAEIGPFFVTRAHQGSRAAHVMMTGVIDEAGQAGIKQIELYVDTENLRAIAFYERQGFKHVATHSDSVRIDGHIRRDHFMTLRLT